MFDSQIIDPVLPLHRQRGGDPYSDDGGDKGDSQRQYEERSRSESR